MRGRALGRGRLIRKKQKSGKIAYVGDWQGADRKRHRKILSSDRRVAERLLAEIIRKRDLALGGLARESASEFSFDEIRERYLEDLRTRVSQNHHGKVEKRLEKILDAFKDWTILELRPDLVLEWRAQRLKEGVSNRTANMDVGSLKAMLNWAVQAELIAQNPLQRLRPLPEGASHRRFKRRALSEDEIDRFLRAALEDDRREAARKLASKTIDGATKGRRYARKPRQTRIPQLPFWMGFLETGARWSELRRTVWGDLGVDQQILRLRAVNTKSGKERVIPVRSNLLESLLGLRAIQKGRLGRWPSDKERIFLTPDAAQWDRSSKNALRIFRRILRAAEIDVMDESGRQMDIHALRHTFASRLARSGVGLLHAQRLLGHSNPALTAEIYTHLDSEDLRDAVGRLPETKACGGGLVRDPRLRVKAGTKLAHVEGSPMCAARKSLQELVGDSGLEPPTPSLSS